MFINPTFYACLQALASGYHSLVTQATMFDYLLYISMFILPVHVENFFSFESRVPRSNLVQAQHQICTAATALFAMQDCHHHLPSSHRTRPFYASCLALEHSSLVTPTLMVANELSRATPPPRPSTEARAHTSSYSTPARFNQSHRLRLTCLLGIQQQTHVSKRR